MTDLHAVNSTLQDSGFGPTLLCSLVVFADPDGRRLGLVYLFKQGTFYPFAPAEGSGTTIDDSAVRRATTSSRSRSATCCAATSRSSPRPAAGSPSGARPACRPSKRDLGAFGRCRAPLRLRAGLVADAPRGRSCAGGLVPRPRGFARRPSGFGYGREVRSVPRRCCDAGRASMRSSATRAQCATSGSTAMRLTTVPVDQVLQRPHAGAAGRCGSSSTQKHTVLSRKTICWSGCASASRLDQVELGADGPCAAGRRAPRPCLMMNSVEPTRSALRTTSCVHSGCTSTLTPGIRARGRRRRLRRVKRPCTEQWPLPQDHAARRAAARR